MQKKIQQMTDFTVNSCESAQKLVNGAFGEIAAHSTTACENLARSKGVATDAAAAKEYCKSAANARSILNPATMTATEKENTVVHRNILWHGLGKNNLINTDITMKEYLMSLVGTIVVNQDTGGNPKPEYKVPLLSANNAINDIMYGNQNTSMYICNTASDPECLNPIKTTGITITGVVGNVRTALDEIRSKLETEATTGIAPPLTQKTQSLLTISSLPIIKMMTNAVALGPSVALQIENELVNPIAFGIAGMYLDWAFTTAKEGVFQEINLPESLLRTYMRNIRDKQKDFRELSKKVNIMSTSEIIRKAQFLERLLIANLSPHFQEVMQYSKSF